jgi:diguanylate cyclase (GGDEF)-like protein
VKLRLKLLLLLLPLVIAPLFSLGWIAYSELRQVSEDRLLEEMRATLEHLEGHASNELHTALANIELFARHTLVKKYVLTEDEMERYDLLQPPLLRVFGSFQEAFPQYYEIRILLTDGYEDTRLTKADIDNHSDEEADNPLFQAMLRAPDKVTSLVMTNPDNGQPSLFVGKPLVLRDPAFEAIGVPPKLRGYLLLTADLGNLQAHIRADNIGENGFLLATDGRGKAVFQPDAISAPLTLPPHLLDQALSTMPGSAPLLSEIDGQASYIRVSRVLPDLYLFAVLPQAEMLAASSRVAGIVAAITLATVVLTAACLFLALHFLVIDPLHRLQKLSKDIGRGQLEIYNTLHTSDEMGELASTFEDMADNLRRSNEQIHYIAYHDNLTGLPNRAMFHEYLTRVIADARRSGKQFAVLFLDIDDFKRVNDTLGHQAGDRLLQEVTDRLSHCLRRADYVARMDNRAEADELLARLGGDEFVILLPDLKDPHAASSLAGRILTTLGEAITLDQHEFFVSASIGITLYPSDGKQADELIRNADIAMYHAKEQGKNDYQYYLESMNVMAHERLAVEAKLRKALENNELSLHYQPQVDTATGAIVGLEALLRWISPEDGFISPGVFVPVAEETGLILPIGEWVINEACRQSREWLAAGLPTPTISVNVSGTQFGKQDVPRILRGALARYELEPRQIEIEITESVIMSQPELAVREFSTIQDQGVAIALDDFGTGYSSFSYLHRFPIDTLKIDRSFVMEVHTSEENAEIVAAIIAMAHILGLRVVAEGIEEAAQHAILSERGCDMIQGYLFSRPLPAQDIPPLLQKGVLTVPEPEPEENASAASVV